MSVFHMDMIGTKERFQFIDRTGKSCAIRNNGKYMKVPCAWCGKPCKALRCPAGPCRAQRVFTGHSRRAPHPCDPPAQGLERA